MMTRNLEKKIRPIPMENKRRKKNILFVIKFGLGIQMNPAKI